MAADERDNAARAGPESGQSFLLDGLETRTDRQHVHCRVSLHHRPTAATLLGEASDLNTPGGHARAAARATLAAALTAGHAPGLAFEGAQLVSLFGRHYVAVSLEALRQRQPSHTTELALIERSIHDAACAATVATLNRWAAGTGSEKG
jgi:hypothetical protein